jgi:hypothetical protein
MSRALCLLGMGSCIVHQSFSVLDVPVRERVLRLLSVVTGFFEIRFGLRRFKGEPTCECDS